jgi:hypothetical protein
MSSKPSPSRGSITDANVSSFISGNATNDEKLLVVHRVLGGLTNEGRHFADAVGSRIRVVDIEVIASDHAPKKKSVTVVCEITVEQGTPSL